VLNKLLPEIPERHRAMVALAAGTGLRWGELAGLRWTDLDLNAVTVTVSQVAVEVSGAVTIKGYPKSRAGRRTVPVPDFAVRLLRELAEGRDAGEEMGGNWRGLVFTNTVGEPLQRGHFRGRVWRPALVRAGLLGSVTQVDAKTWQAAWLDAKGKPQRQECPSERQARALVARMAQGGLRFHDLRHSYATWLVTRGVPLNDVARVMGHEHISTTLDRYTHSSRGGQRRVLDSFADFSLTEDDER
jgi:integrase